MEVLVLGATGSLGRSLINELVRRGHLTRAASRRQRPATRDGARWVRVDLTTGEGLAQAVGGVDAVIDAANSRSPRRSALEAVLVTGTRRVLDACQAAGDVHYVGISIIGIDDVPLPYYRAKLLQGAVIQNGPAPWSLLRATQFHDLVDQLFRAAVRLPAMVLPTAVKLQPIDVADVARRLADVAEDPAAGRLTDIGGPRVQAIGDLAEDWLHARGGRKRMVELPVPGRVGRALRAGSLTVPEHAVGGLDFAGWLAATGPGRGTPGP